MSAVKVQKRLFGTNGVRGVTGRDMTPALAMKIGMALGSMRKGRIAVGRDTRTSGPALSSAVKAGLLACGCDVTDVGVLPTPALQYIIKNHFDGGAMITASHNPPEYNGVKVIDADGTEMGDEDTLLLEDRIFDETFEVQDWRNVGTETSAPHMVEEYIDAIVSAFPEGIGNGITVVADPGSGPACLTTPVILRKLGCTVHTINGQPDGTFPGRLPEPSPEGLYGLSELVKACSASFGIAHDGDADRAVFVDENGEFVEENSEFALVQRFMCRKGDGLVVTPVSTSMKAEDVAKETGCEIVYTPVGSIYVAREMIRLKKEGKDVLFGGEGNGGLIYPDFQFCRDGGMSGATMVALLADADKPLSELIESLPGRVMIREKLYTTDFEAVLSAVKKAFAEDDLDLTDGIRINRENMWALLRPSGTEPFMRLFVEAASEPEARPFTDEIIGVIKGITS